LLPGFFLEQLGHNLTMIIVTRIDGQSMSKPSRPSPLVDASRHILLQRPLQLPSRKLTKLLKITMLLIGKPSINGPFSMAMLNNQMVFFQLVATHPRRILFFFA
jgi:hypothetical protein